MWKNALLKKRKPSEIFFEVLFLPTMVGVLLRLLPPIWDCKDDDDAEACLAKQGWRNLIVPFLLVVYIPNLVSLSAKFVLSNIVLDKQTKMRETLKIMSLTRFSYTISYFLF